MSKVYKIKLENGYFLFKLEEILEKKKISKNKLMRDTNTDFKVIKRLSTGECTRMDIFIIARMCDYLDCDMNEIVEYVRK